MKKNPTFLLQITAGLLLAGLLALILASKVLVGGDAVDPSGPEPGIDAGGPRPEQKLRVYSGRLDACLLILAPLHLEDRRTALDHEWLARNLSPGEKVETFLYLHLFHEEGGKPVSIDPIRDRIELRLEDGGKIRNDPLGPRLRRRTLRRADRLILRAMVPPRPFTLQPNDMARMLLCFPGERMWPRIAGVRFHHGGQTVDLAPRDLTYVAWESLLAGGPIPEKLFPPVREAAVPGK